MPLGQDKGWRRLNFEPYKGLNIFALLMTLAVPQLVVPFTELVRMNPYARMHCDETAIETVTLSWARNPFNGWSTEDGDCYYDLETFMLQSRAISATFIAESPTTDAAMEERRAELREWLPSSEHLTHLVKHVRYFDGQMAAHPSLLCAALHGSVLGDWAPAAKVAEEMLAFSTNPLNRLGALRLLARCHREVGQSMEMCETLERATSEANATGFVLFELVVLRDLHEELEERERADVRVRLGTVIDCMETTAADVQRMLDGSELDAAGLVAEARRAASS